ncbi:MAG: hypothetical protein ACLQU2_14855 [Candidatus Binataceae bacterium]
MSATAGNPKSWTSTLLAFAIYQALAILWFGTPLLSDFSHTYIGLNLSADPAGYMWFLKWWPYAVSNHLNPFITKLIWAPSGFNLTWASSIPLPALAAAPITQIWGPVAAWNILCLIAPALAAWCAFILCRHLCDAFLPALVGGYLFGFSPYMLGHLLGHLSLILIFPVPLSAYLVILRVEGRLSRATFVSLLTILALVIFLCCQELLAATVVIGVLVMAATLLSAGPRFRRDLLDVCGLVAVALASAAIFLSPYLYYALFRGFPHGPINPPAVYSSDLLAFFVPTPTLLIGQHPAIASLAQRLVGGWAEDTAYIGIPLFLMILDYGVSNWRDPRARIMLVALPLIALASLGPYLHIEGTSSIPLPWALAGQLPLLDKALPGRFMMFAFLDAGLITAIYLASSPHRTRKWILALLAVASLIPNLPAGWWFSRLDTPRFFADGTFRRYLDRGETALILPYGREGKSMLWQAQAGMYFRMAGGYVGLTPRDFLRWPVLDSLYNGEACYDFTHQLGFFLAAHQIRTIVLAHDARRTWPPLLTPLHMEARKVNDVTLYKTSPGLLAAYAGVTAHEAAARAAEDAFSAMAIAANEYWAKALPLQKLTPWGAARLGLLSLPGSDTPTNPEYPQWWRNMWLGSLDASTVSIGISGNYEDLKGTVTKYQSFANETFFPFPEKFSATRSVDRDGLLLITFDRPELARAAALAATPKWRR